MPCLSGAVQGRRVFTLPASFPFLSENDNSSPESKQNRARNAQMRNAPANPLELLELLDRLAGPGEDTENVEPDLRASAKTPTTQKHQLGHTVLLRGLHWPTTTMSPSSTRKAGET